MEEAKTSKLARELSNLENDFRYNLALMKLKDSEIERCTKTNIMLQNALNAKFMEIEDLHTKILVAEKKVEKSEFKRENEKLTCKQTIASLTESLNDVTLKLQERIDKCAEDSLKKENSLKDFYTSLLRKKEEEYKNNVLAVEDRLQKEICMMMMHSSLNQRCKSGQNLSRSCRINETDASALKITNKKSKKVKKTKIRANRTFNRMQNLTDENVSLRNRIIKLESQYTAEKCVLETEIENLKTTFAETNKEIALLKSERADLTKDIDKLKFDNGVLDAESRLNSEKMQNLLKQYKSVVLENKNTKQQYQDMAKLNKSLIVTNEGLGNKKRELELKCEELTNALKECKESVFNQESLNNYDSILKQNIVLKDLVKQMKYEKEQIENTYVSEDRIRKLEDLVEVLKKRAYGDS